jgi:glucose dehydrogenase
MKMQVGFAALIFAALVSTQTKAWEFENWPMYGKDPSHSFSNPLTQINARNVASLTPAWTFPTGDAVTASPAVVDGVVYVGSWDGFFYAIDAGTGELRWKVQADCQPSVVPLPQVCGGPAAGTSSPNRFQTPGGIITSSAAVVDDRVYFGGGRTLYSVSARDGQVVWKHVICGNPEDTNCLSDQNDPLQILSSPVVSGGKIYVGVSTGGVNFGIPYRGGFLALDAKSGEQLWRFEVDADRPNGMNRGCGNVWSSPALDPEAQMVFFGTLTAKSSRYLRITAQLLRSMLTVGVLPGCFVRANPTPTSATLISGHPPTSSTPASTGLSGSAERMGPTTFLTVPLGRSFGQRELFSVVVKAVSLVAPPSMEGGFSAQRRSATATS